MTQEHMAVRTFWVCIALGSVWVVASGLLVDFGVSAWARAETEFLLVLVNALAVYWSMRRLEAKAFRQASYCKTVSVSCPTSVVVHNDSCQAWVECAPHETLRELEIATSRGKTAGEKETILLAEDEEPVRSMMSLILRKAGYTVLEARNGAEAVKLFQDCGGKVSGVVMDVVMPQMGGLEAYAKIRALSPHMPVTFASACSVNRLQAHLEAGAEANLLHKPFGQDALLGVVRSMLNGES